MHCIIQGNQAQINSVKDLRNMYLDKIDLIGSFTDEYYIFLKPDNHLVIYMPRKCPMQMRDEIKTELDDMMKQGIIC